MELFLEDLEVGQRFATGTYKMTEERIKAFAAEFDVQPFHLDDEAAQASVFGGLAASGWHTVAATMRLLTIDGTPFANGIIGVGCDVAWPKPTRPRDVLQAETEIVEITPSLSKPHQAIVTVRITTFNQNREAVCVMTPKILVFRRGAE